MMTIFYVSLLRDYSRGFDNGFLINGLVTLAIQETKMKFLFPQRDTPYYLKWGTLFVSRLPAGCRQAVLSASKCLPTVCQRLASPPGRLAGWQPGLGLGLWLGLGLELGLGLVRVMVRVRVSRQPAASQGEGQGASRLLANCPFCQQVHADSLLAGQRASQPASPPAIRTVRLTGRLAGWQPGLGLVLRLGLGLGLLLAGSQPARVRVWYTVGLGSGQGQDQDQGQDQFQGEVQG